MVLCRSGSFGLENARYPFGLSLSKPGLVRWFGRCACVECGGRVVAPAGDSLFFASPKKSKQKKGDPQSATPSLCEGANLRRGGCGVRRGTRFAPAARRSDNHGESVHEAWALRRPCHPTTAPPQAQPAGGGLPNIQTAPRAFASLGPISRAQAPRAAQAGPSAAMARVDVRLAGSLLSGAGGRACFETPPPGVCGAARRGRAGGAAAPPGPAPPGLPRSAARGSQTAGSPFLWFLSFGDAKERDSPAGATTRPPPPTQARRPHQRTSSPRLRQAQPERAGVIRTPKTTPSAQCHAAAACPAGTGCAPIPSRPRHPATA